MSTAVIKTIALSVQLIHKFHLEQEDLCDIILVRICRAGHKANFPENRRPAYLNCLQIKFKAIND
jgi:hypothetical protein